MKNIKKHLRETLQDLIILEFQYPPPKSFVETWIKALQKEDFDCPVLLWDEGDSSHIDEYGRKSSLYSEFSDLIEECFEDTSDKMTIYDKILLRALKNLLKQY